MTEYISKPIRLKKLVKMVEGYLEKS